MEPPGHVDEEPATGLNIFPVESDGYFGGRKPGHFSPDDAGQIIVLGGNGRDRKSYSSRNKRNERIHLADILDYVWV